jgi:hypothetical protein
MAERRRITVDANEATVSVAHRLSEANRRVRLQVQDIPSQRQYEGNWGKD